MNRPRCTDTDYVDFLVATPRAVSGTAAARVQPRRPAAPAHDALTRLLHRLEPDPATLWHEIAPLVERGRGVLKPDHARLERNHTGMAIRAGCPLGRMRLEWRRLRTGIGWKTAKEGIIRHAIRSYRTRP